MFQRRLTRSDGIDIEAPLPQGVPQQDCSVFIVVDDQDGSIHLEYLPFCRLSLQVVVRLASRAVTGSHHEDVRQHGREGELPQIPLKPCGISLVASASQHQCSLELQS